MASDSVRMLPCGLLLQDALFSEQPLNLNHASANATRPQFAALGLAPYADRRVGFPVLALVPSKPHRAVGLSAGRHSKNALPDLIQLVFDRFPDKAVVVVLVLKSDAAQTSMIPGLPWPLEAWPPIPRNGFLVESSPSGLVCTPPHPTLAILAPLTPRHKSASFLSASQRTSSNCLPRQSMHGARRPRAVQQSSSSLTRLESWKGHSPHPPRMPANTHAVLESQELRRLWARAMSWAMLPLRASTLATLALHVTACAA